MILLHENKGVRVTLWLSLLNVLNVLVYSSFLMNACMVWADFEDKVSVNSKAFSVILWIKLEFLIFVVNLFTIPSSLLFLTLSQWFQGGFKLVYTSSSRIVTDLLEKRIHYVDNFTTFAVAGAVALSLIKNKELLEKAQGADDRFVQKIGSDLNIYLMIGIACGQFVAYAIINLVSIFPSWEDTSKVGAIN